MKKIYFAAQMNIVALRNHNIIVTSGFGMDGKKAEVETLNDNYESEGFTISW